MKKIGNNTNSNEKTSQTGQNSNWNWHPELPMPNSPIASWPIQPLKMIKDLFFSWLPVSEKLLIMGIAILTWFYCSPSIDQFKNFSLGWIVEIYIRNLVLLILVAGGLHLYLYMLKGQGDKFRYESRSFKQKSQRFTFNNQVYDNIFWSLGSGVTVWTLYEVFVMWAYANGLMPTLLWEENPIIFVISFVFIPLFGNFHFYWIHRLIHWQPLYKAFHHIHHRNVVTGPWSGLSMHPLEHLLYLSSVLIHFIIASHPIHIIFHLMTKTLLAPTSHSGFEKVTSGSEKETGLKVGDFFHQLHLFLI